MPGPSTSTTQLFIYRSGQIDKFPFYQIVICSIIYCGFFKKMFYHFLPNIDAYKYNYLFCLNKFLTTLVLININKCKTIIEFNKCPTLAANL